MLKLIEKNFNLNVIVSLLITTSIVSHIVAGESTAIKQDLGFQGEARELVKQRNAVWNTMCEKYRILMARDAVLTDITVLTEGAKDTFVSKLITYVPDFLTDCQEAGLTSESELTALWRLRTLWIEVRRRTASLNPDASPALWEELSSTERNNGLANKILELFRDGQAKGETLTSLHSHGLVRVIGDIYIRQGFGAMLTSDMTPYYLLGNTSVNTPDLGIYFTRLKNIDLEFAYTALAETFKVCPVDQIIWRQNGDTPLIVYIEGLQKGYVAYTDVLAALDLLDQRAQVAVTEYTLKNQRSLVELCQSWIDEASDKYRQMLELSYGQK